MTKTEKTFYWLTTSLFAAFMLLSGVMEIMQDKVSIDAFASLGYPQHILVTLGVAKLIGGIVLFLPPSKFRTLKEWAYAGFTFDLIGAATAIAVAGQYAAALFPLAFFILLVPSYLLWKKTTGQPVTL